MRRCDTCPNVTVLTTSREPLADSGGDRVAHPVPGVSILPHSDTDDVSCGGDASFSSSELPP